MRFLTDRRFDVEIHLPDKVMRGCTELPDRDFSPIIEWAQGYAQEYGTPVPWTIRHRSVVIEQGVARPG